MDLISAIIELAQWPNGELPKRQMSLARLSLLDWIVCGLAGTREPVAVKLRAFASAEAGTPVASLIGGDLAPARMAALVNGATTHALDYDDTHFAHVGHLSVGIFPAALAAGEEADAQVRDVIASFLVGAETAIRIGLALGRDHYRLGFHQTATAGAFGATVAAGRLYELDAAQMRAAIGLCATRASGLKSQFGTMGKPYNAGIAASNGVECAMLARLNLSSADDGLMGAQGFVDTHTPDNCLGVVQPHSADSFLFGDNRYKFHACCHGTHAMIEALLNVRESRSLGIGDIAALELKTNPRWLSVCDIKTPRTGLEVKFSYGWLAGMVLRGDETGDHRKYLSSLATDPQLAEFSERVAVIGDDSLTDLQAVVGVSMVDGTSVSIAHDLADPVAEEVLGARLRHKAICVIGKQGEEIWGMLPRLHSMSARELGLRLRHE